MVVSLDNKRSGRKILITIILLIIALIAIKVFQSYSKPDVIESLPKSSKPTGANTSNKQVKEIPIEAIQTYDYALKNNGKARPGYRGNTKFGNRENLLPVKKGNVRLSYKEYDIYPYKKGKNRGPHRVVISSDNTGYYTSDHYKSFKQIDR